MPENSDTPERQEASSEGMPAEKERPRGRSRLAFFAFLFSLAALAGTAWMWWQDQSSLGLEEERMFEEMARLDGRDSELSLKLSEVRDELARLNTGDVSAEWQALQDRLQADRAKMEQVEKALDEQMSLARSLQAAADSVNGRMLAAEAALTGMSTRELDAGGELDLAEVDYLLRLANERLKLFTDPVGADQALEVADTHLAALDNPMYTGVRQDIAAARRNLAAVDIPDYLDLASQLDSIQQRIAQLPFKSSDPQKQDGSAAAADGWWEKVKGVFSNLVTIRRSTDEENARISLQDKDFIRQRLWLQLEIAHLALMRRDQKAFTIALERVRESLVTWFDPADSSVQSVSDQLDALDAIKVRADVPDITAPWSTLRLLRAGQSRPVALPPAREPEPVGEEIEPVVEEIESVVEEIEPVVEEESGAEEEQG
ncbi:MAG: hypothetical protein HKN57_14815 [Xanthomonadales bacterium]|nr:hypothetical protein [Xanthomonadales bacterium]